MSHGDLLDPIYSAFTFGTTACMAGTHMKYEFFKFCHLLDLAGMEQRQVFINVQRIQRQHKRKGPSKNVSINSLVYSSFGKRVTVICVSYIYV